MQSISKIRFPLIFALLVFVLSAYATLAVASDYTGVLATATSLPEVIPDQALIALSRRIIRDNCHEEDKEKLLKEQFPQSSNLERERARGRLKSLLSLSGIAFDLWDSRIELAELSKELTVFAPFSTSNCGYCLIDGEYFKENIKKPVEKEGGRYFGLCLWNTQLEILSHLKHYREDSTVLTGPQGLYRYHLDGFPWMSVFSAGECVWSGVVDDFYAVFNEFRDHFLRDKNTPHLPVGMLRFGLFYIADATPNSGVMVFPDDCPSKNLEPNKNFATLRESQLTPGDLQKSVWFRGDVASFSLASITIQSPDCPICLASGSVTVGGQSFPLSEVCLTTSIPNPFNPERYLCLNLRGKGMKQEYSGSWVDFCVFKDGSQGEPEILLEGVFKKDGQKWAFDPKMARGSALKQPTCENGVCRMPEVTTTEEQPRDSAPPSIIQETASGANSWVLGTSEAHFPVMLRGRDETMFVSWDEDGKIALAKINGKKDEEKSLWIQSDSSDSFNPLLAGSEGALWIFYLNNRDGIYRLYSRTYDGKRISKEILVSRPEELIDCILPSVTSSGTRIVVSWSEWKANSKILNYREIDDGIMGPIHRVAIKKDPKAEPLSFAWRASLAIDSKGILFGAWNQHYPGLLSVCAGDLASEAMAIDLDGGCPSLAFDRKDRPWIFYCSSSFGLPDPKNPQKILAVHAGADRKGWSVPAVISDDRQTPFVQIPQAVMDHEGNIQLCWNGKTDDEAPWGVYYARQEGVSWSSPIRLSREDENARAPFFLPEPKGGLWAAWHSGRGKDIRIRVLHLPTPGK